MNIQEQGKLYWKHHYVIEAPVGDIEKKLSRQTFTSGTKTFELISFVGEKADPNIFIGPGSGGNAYIFAELGYHMHGRGYNVFIMPKNGGYTVRQLMARYQDAAHFVANEFNSKVGAFAEGLGGLVTFYVALAGSPLRSVVLQNAPAILTEADYLAAIMQGKGAAHRRKILLPALRVLATLCPQIPIPINLYLGWKEMIDPHNKEAESRLVDGYLHDPDFDKTYPLAAVVSLVSTPPPKPLSELQTPIRFLLVKQGFIPNYFKNLFSRLPDITKSLVEIDGGVYWMLSHPKEAAQVTCDWFDKTIRYGGV